MCGPLSKLCVTPPFSINFRCQIENQVSDYRLLGASSYSFLPLPVIHIFTTAGHSHFYHCWSFTFLPLPVIHIFTTASHSHFYHCRSFTFLPLSFTFLLHQEHHMIFFSLSYISHVIQIFGIFRFTEIENIH